MTATSRYAVTKMHTGRGGRLVYGRPVYFQQRDTALDFARDAWKSLRAEGEEKGTRIVVTQGASLIREYKV